MRHVALGLEPFQRLSQRTHRLGGCHLGQHHGAQRRADDRLQVIQPTFRQAVDAYQHIEAAGIDGLRGNACGFTG
ncbi:hypothetical protein FQZ97_953930 [compost metagenome]